MKIGLCDMCEEETTVYTDSGGTLCDDCLRMENHQAAYIRDMER